MKIKLSIPEQIEHLKSKGIKFNIINELEAQTILSQNTYYFKLKIYTKNYNKNKNNLYDNVEFAYLYEISKVDLAFRNFVLKLTLNIEHLVKTKLLFDFNISDEDGYAIVEDFLKEHASANSYIKKFKDGNGKGGSYDIVKHYQDELPIWALVEILQFNDLISLCKFFYSKHTEFLNSKSLGLYLISLNSTKWLRNISAHNNCLLIKLNKFDNEIRKHLLRKISPYRMNIEPKDNSYNLEKMLKNTTIEAFLETWLFFLIICNSEEMKKHTKEELILFFEYSKQENKLQARNSSKDIDNFLTLIERVCKII